MKNNFLNILGAACLVLFIGSSMTSCTAEDGIDGINGMDGVNGQDGADGVNGQDGADAIGLEEFAKYGSIELKVQGIRPDSVAFDYESNLEFIAPELSNNSFQEKNSSLEFNFLRILHAPNDDETNGAWITLDVNDAGLPSQNIDFEIEFSDFAIFSDDLKYITLIDTYYGTLNNNNRVNNSYGIASTFTISDYNFDDATNNLKFSFSMTIDKSNNETGNDLSVEGTVDVIVFENLNSRD